jgi:O-6-methylguanine DNA methyltransferase
VGKVFEKIYEEVKKIPRGETRSYGDIAKKINVSPRVVGFALHRNTSPEEIPCHRVVFKNGEASFGYLFGGKEAQEKKLLEEKQ